MRSPAPPRKRALGGLLVALGFAAAASAEAPPAPKPFLAERWARADMEALARALRSYLKQHGTWPSLVDPFPSLDSPHGWRAPRADPWGKPYVLELGDGRAWIVSAGPDSTLDSRDDLVIRVTGGERPPSDLPAIRETARAAAREHPEARAAGSGPPQAPAAPPAPAEEIVPPEDKATRTTRARLDELAGLLASYRRKHGRFPVGDDATRVVKHVLGAPFPAEDGWGRPFAYLALREGDGYVIASMGRNGALDRPLHEDRAGRASAPDPGDDIVLSEAARPPDAR